MLQTLTEKGLMQTAGGRSAFAVLLTQDIAVIPMLALLPLLALPGLPAHTVAESGADLHGAAAPALDIVDEARSLIEAMPPWGVTLTTFAAVAVIILAGVFLTRPIFSYIHATRLREMFTALALLIVVSIAVLMLLVGLSPALGTFLAGVVLANSEFRHEMESDLEPFKGLLLGLFFIAVGMSIDFGVILRTPWGMLALLLGFLGALAARSSSTTSWPRLTSPSASDTTLPCSLVMISASSPLRSLSNSRKANRIWVRLASEVSRQAGNAAAAASMTFCASSTLASAT